MGGSASQQPSARHRHEELCCIGGLSLAWFAQFSVMVSDPTSQLLGHSAPTLQRPHHTQHLLGQGCKQQPVLSQYSHLHSLFKSLVIISILGIKMCSSGF
jgi:hypothetical protein